MSNIWWLSQMFTPLLPPINVGFEIQTNLRTKCPSISDTTLRRRRGGAGFVLRISTLVSCPNTFENDCIVIYELFFNLISQATHRTSAHIRRVAKTKWPTVFLRSNKEGIQTLLRVQFPKMWNKSTKYEIKIFRDKQTDKKAAPLFIKTGL